MWECEKMENENTKTEVRVNLAENRITIIRTETREIFGAKGAEDGTRRFRLEGDAGGYSYVRDTWITAGPLAGAQRYPWDTAHRYRGVNVLRADKPGGEDREISRVPLNGKQAADLIRAAVLKAEGVPL
jgi:hypothetical protein